MLENLIHNLKSLLEDAELCRVNNASDVNFIKRADETKKRIAERESELIAELEKIQELKNSKYW